MSREIWRRSARKKGNKKPAHVGKLKAGFLDIRYV